MQNLLKTVLENDEKWQVSNKYPQGVISNTPARRMTDIEYYGGYLVCESIANPVHARLIAAAPDLLEAIQYYFSVLEEATGKDWYKRPDHVLQKMLKAVQKVKA